ncbi:unnamed protein product [Mytilus coruscus]|uniref:Uncharacterized protein n=2 Tax=Mytilus coruscus TaxID=42192 RepID=A0A6J8A6D9_MYTCO|nr:unnamed protein product [Mytilus coruscus]
MLKEIQRLTKSGILISRSDEHYQSLSKEAVYNRLKQISSSTKSTETDSTLASEINRLMTLERQINLKIWHDHSDILNHTYISFMVSFIYDHANFLTNEEFRETYPKKKPVDVQAVVETKPVHFWTIRTEDLEELRKGIIFDGIPYTFQLRFFSGDGPARQFEAGQQRGGNFSCLCGVHSKEHMNLECCFKRTPSDLEDRRAVFLKGESLVKIKQGNINPFQNLTKDELIEELECRGFDTFRLKTKARLQINIFEKERAIIDIWQTSLDKAASSELVLPLLHVKTKEDGKLIYKRTNLKSVSSEHALLNPINFIPDDNSESTEDYIPNIPIVQEPPEVPAIDQGRKHQEDKENKEKYKSYIKVSRWTVQPTCSKIDVHESLFNKPNKLPGIYTIFRFSFLILVELKEANFFLLFVVILLFTTPFSKQNFRFQLTGQRHHLDARGNYSRLKFPNKKLHHVERKTTLDMVVQLLGPSSDVDDCLKYRKLKLKHPGHKSFISAFDQSFSKLQIEVSKRYFALKEETTKDDGKENRENLLADKEIAQKLLDHWGMYYF